MITNLIICPVRLYIEKPTSERRAVLKLVLETVGTKEQKVDDRILAAARDV